MAVDELSLAEEAEGSRSRDRLIGVYIGVLAVILAICSLGGGNATKDAMQKNIEAANTWAFFQAKNLRRHVLRVQVDELELLLRAQPGLSEEARVAIETKIKQYREHEKALTSDPKTHEGLDELFQRAKAIEQERDLAASKDPYFDYAQALLQIAIVLASVAIVAGGTFLLVASAMLGVLGTLLTINGFMPIVSLPLLG